MRLLLAAALVTCGLVISPAGVWPVRAVPGACPPICDAIPDSAWIVPTSIPLYSVYRWPGLASLAVTASSPKFGFEALCDSPPLPDDARSFVVGARSVVPNPAGQWNLAVQVMHWRGDAVHSGPIASAILDSARPRLRACQLTAPKASPSVTTDEPERITAVISAAGEQVMHEYLLVHPASSTIVELAMWSTLPPAVDWPAVPDAQIFEALIGPLCSAYIGSCR